MINLYLKLNMIEKKKKIIKKNYKRFYHLKWFPNNLLRVSLKSLYSLLYIIESPFSSKYSNISLT